jgi:hypothetical protein
MIRTWVTISSSPFSFGGPVIGVVERHTLADDLSLRFQHEVRPEQWQRDRITRLHRTDEAEAGGRKQDPYMRPRMRRGWLDVDQWPALRGRADRPMVPLRMRSAVAMRLHTYRDKSRSRHFDLIGGGGHPWSIDLVSVAVSAMLMAGFACALIAQWIR